MLLFQQSCSAGLSSCSPAVMVGRVRRCALGICSRTTKMRSRIFWSMLSEGEQILRRLRISCNIEITWTDPCSWGSENKERYQLVQESAQSSVAIVITIWGQEGDMTVAQTDIGWLQHTEHTNINSCLKEMWNRVGVALDVSLLLVGGSTNQFHHYLDVAHPFLPCFLCMCVFKNIKGVWLGDCPSFHRCVRPSACAMHEVCIHVCKYCSFVKSVHLRRSTRTLFLAQFSV